MRGSEVEESLAPSAKGLQALEDLPRWALSFIWLLSGGWIQTQPYSVPPPTTPNMDAASDGSAQGDGANGRGLLRPPMVHRPLPVAGHTPGARLCAPTRLTLSPCQSDKRCCLASFSFLFISPDCSPAPSRRQDPTTPRHHTTLLRQLGPTTTTNFQHNCGPSPYQPMVSSNAPDSCCRSIGLATATTTRKPRR